MTSTIFLSFLPSNPVLQGYMYLTNSHLCFFAHMPSREVSLHDIASLLSHTISYSAVQDQVLKSGTLSKRASRTKRWNKHWFVLKNDVLSWYQSSTVCKVFYLVVHYAHSRIDFRTHIFHTVMLIYGTLSHVTRWTTKASSCGPTKRRYPCVLIQLPAERNG